MVQPVAAATGPPRVQPPSLLPPPSTARHHAWHAAPTSGIREGGGPPFDIGRGGGPPSGIGSPPPPSDIGRGGTPENAHGKRVYRRFIYKGDASTQAQGTDPRVALGA